MVYPTQYSKIVIEVKYCACPTSELNGWVIFAGKKSNYELSLNCLRERQTLGMFFFSIFLLSLSCFLMSFFPFLLSLSCFLISFFPFLLFLFPILPPLFSALFSRSPFCPFSPVLHSFMLSSSPYTMSYPYHFLLFLLPVLHPLFLSSTILPLCPPLICIIFIRLFYFFCLYLLIFHVINHCYPGHHCCCYHRLAR